MIIQTEQGMKIVKLDTNLCAHWIQVSVLLLKSESFIPFIHSILLYEASLTTVKVIATITLVLIAISYNDTKHL